MISLNLLRLLFFVGVYVFMGSLTCFEVVPRIKNDSIKYVKRLTNTGIILLVVSLSCLILFCCLLTFG